MKIGLFGGTLDPIHLGHLRSAEEVREALSLDEVWFVPAFRPPHKLDRDITPFEQRIKMVELAVAGSPYFKASRIEQERGAISYTIDLLKYLLSKDENKGHLFYFILGSDGFMEIDMWKDYKSLIEIAPLVVLKRMPHVIQDILTKASAIFPEARAEVVNETSYCVDDSVQIYVFSPTQLDISATDIRNRISLGMSVKYLVPEEVRKFIMTEKLYKKSSNANDPTPTGQSESLAAAQKIFEEILNNKGEKTIILDMRGSSPVADFFIITQGRSTRHVQGMASRMRKELSRKHLKCKGIEGEEEGKWILMDFDDVIVHIFYEPIRGFYDLEGLWSEAPRLSFSNGQLVEESQDEQE